MNADNTEKGATMQTERVTLYFRGEMMGNIHKVEARSAEIEVRGYAQYQSAVQVRFVPKGARRQRGFVQTFQPSLVVVDGWGHPDPDGIFGASEKISDDVSFARGRHSGHSDGWQNDFDAMLSDHVEKTGAKIVADYRGHNPHDRFEATG